MNERNDLVQPDNTETTSTALQPMSFVDILDGMFSLYRSHFRLFFRIVVVYLIFGFVLNLVSTSIVTAAMSGTSIVMVLLTSIASVLFTYWIGWGLAYASAQVYLSRDITPQAALQQALRRYLSLLGSTFLYFLVVGGLFMTIIGIPFSIYFAFRWSLYMLPVLFEETTARNALRRSTELVRGTWWRVCGIMIAIYLIAFMIVFILQTSYAMIFSSLAGGAETVDANFLETLRRLFAPTPDDIGWGRYLLHTFGSLTIGGLTMPIGTIGAVLLYFDLRIRKEAFDIEMQVTD